jgi:hypothetical protein
MPHRPRRTTGEQRLAGRGELVTLEKELTRHREVDAG